MCVCEWDSNDFLHVIKVPNYYLIERSCYQLRSVITPTHAINHPIVVNVFGKGAEFCARRHIPHLYHPVPTPADDAGSVRAHVHALYRARVPGEGVEFLARRRVPHLHRTVKTPADDPRAVRAHVHALYRARVPAECVEFAARRHIPHPHRHVLTPADDAGSVRAHAHPIYRPPVATYFTHQTPVTPPNSYFSFLSMIATSADDPFTILADAGHVSFSGHNRKHDVLLFNILCTTIIMPEIVIEFNQQ